jgi:hypothetical protein
MKRLIGIVAAALAFSSPALAGMASGTYNHDFTGVETPLWDISGSYSDSSFGISFNLTEDPSGVLSGAGTFDLNDTGFAVLSGSAVITGSIKGSPTAPKVSLNASTPNGSGTVTDIYGTHNVTFTGKLSMNYSLDVVNRQLVSTGGSIVLRGLYTDTHKKINYSFRLRAGDSTLDLPIDSDGHWNVTVKNLTANRTKYFTTTAEVDTSGQQVTDYTATGTYTPRTDTSKIVVKGKGGSSLTLVVITAGSDMTVKSAKGKMFGQTINFTAPPPP